MQDILDHPRFMRLSREILLAFVCLWVLLLPYLVPPPKKLQSKKNNKQNPMGCTRKKVTGSRGKIPLILGKRPLVWENLTKIGGWSAMKRDFV